MNKKDKVKTIALSDLENGQPVSKMQSILNERLKVEDYESAAGIRDAIGQFYRKEIPDFYEPPKQVLCQTDVSGSCVMEKMQLGWMKFEDGTRCMPYIKGHSDENMYRVNYCPSCGKYVRDVMIEP